MDSIKIGREELYELVWSKPITKIAKDYNISDSMVIKICKKLGVPRPGPGHWTKIAVGKTVKQKPLGKLPKGCQEQYRISAYEQQRRQLSSSPNHPLIDRESQDEYLITVTEIPEYPLPLVARNIKSFNNASVSKKLTLKPRAKNHFDLHVTESTKDRALAVMNALLLGFEKRGWAFQMHSEPELKMTVTVLDEVIPFHIEEKIRHVDHVLTEKEIKARKAGKWIWPPRYDLEPTGRLTLQIHAGYGLASRQSWSDGKVQRVEDCLNKFCVALVQLALATKVRREERAEEERLRELERARRAELKEARKAELNKREGFDRSFERWDKARRMRQFIGEMDAITLVAGESGEEMQEWLDWARNYADLVDPLAKGRDTVVEEKEGQNLNYW